MESPSHFVTPHHQACEFGQLGEDLWNLPRKPAAFDLDVTKILECREQHAWDAADELYFEVGQGRERRKRRLHHLRRNGLPLAAFATCIVSRQE